MSRDRIVDLKSKLAAELAKSDLDFGEIALISQKLLEQDQNSVGFSVDAKHIHRLGFELVGKQETALSELIKNAYDADATKLIIEFKEYSKPGGGLSIRDNGHGMTIDQVRNGWMRISTDDKEQNPVSPLYGRNRAGKKGIGRFAVERLGKRLALETGVQGEDKAVRVEFNWDEEFQQGREISTIRHQIQWIPKEKKESGTKLYIIDLRDRWTEKGFESVWKSVLLLQPPYRIRSIDRPKKGGGKEYDPDPGFRVYINGRLGDDVAKEISIEKTFLDHSLATISGYIDKSGTTTYTVESEKLNLTESIETANRFFLTGPLRFGAKYFVYRSGLITGFSLKQAIQMGEKYGGIRIYKDGFRVLSYGEPGNDWLRLAYDQARRNLLIPANNQNFFGHVEILSNENILFEETSSREGLVENEAYYELQQFLRSGLEWAAQRVAAVRLRKEKSGQKNFVSQIARPSEKVRQIIDEVKREKAPTGEQSKQASLAVERLEELKQEQIAFETQVEIREKEFVQYETMLRILSSLGLSISVFAHEVKGALTSFQASLKEVLSLYEIGEPQKKPLLELKNVNSRLFELSQYITSIINHAATRDKSNIALHSVIHSFAEQFDRYLNVRGISFSINVDPPFLRTHPMHRSEIDSVLFNLLTNAVKAIERAKSSVRKIGISAYPERKYAVIAFQDSGTGISESIKDRIFDAFYTTTQFNEDEIAGPGTGLGLRIVRDIAEASGGYVELGEPEGGFKTRFNFAVPLAEEQI